MSTDLRAVIATAGTALGIEFGSVHIRAVLIDPGHGVLATGGRGWENYLGGGLWSYTLDEVVAGLCVTCASLIADVRGHYDVIPASYGSTNISAMMYGYPAFDAEGNLLAPFRTQRSTSMGRVADEFIRPFGFNIPLHWSVAYLHQTVLGSEEHVPRVARLTTLIDWVHRQLTGRHVLDTGGAPGMSPVDSETGAYVESHPNQYEALVKARVPWRLRDVFPTVLSAGEDAGTPTPEGATLIDPTDTPQAGIALCLPRGDASTGMIITDAITQRTGDISYDTSVFLMTVLERSLVELRTEINMATIPDGSPVAIVHLSDGASELDTWVGWFIDFAHLVDAGVSIPTIHDALYNHVLTDETDTGGVTACNALSVELLVDQEVIQSAFAHTADVRVSLASVVRAQLMSISTAVRIDIDILYGEGVHPDSLFAHGGLFKTLGAAQQILVGSLNIPVPAGDATDEGGAQDITVLACYRAVLARSEAAPALPSHPSEWVFAGASVSTLEPAHEDMVGYGRLLDTYRATLPGMKAITQGSAR